MAIQIINNVAGSGDSLKQASDKINQNFAEAGGAAYTQSLEIDAAVALINSQAAAITALTLRVDALEA